LWRLRKSAEGELRRELADYLDRIGPLAAHQAVA
jgi:hypothetical protein